MPDFNHIDLSTDDSGIATLSIDRPKALNALNADVLTEVYDATQTLEQQDDLRALIVTGKGRAFVAGADIAAMKEMSEDEAREFGALGHRAIDALAALPIPTLAAVNGFALGGGLELALGCDLIYAAESAKLGLPEVGLGIIPGFGGTQRLGRRVGWQQARALVFTGQQINAQKAHSMGLVVDVFGDDELLDEVRAIANSIASKGPVAVARAKAVMQKGAEAPLEEALQHEVDAFADLWNTEDRSEGMGAFIEKRSPQFKGS